MNGFSNLIKTKRLEKGLTLSELEQLSGVSSSYINRIENGYNKQPSYEIVINIAIALDISDEEVKNAYREKINSAETLKPAQIRNLLEKMIELKFSIALKESFISTYNQMSSSFEEKFLYKSINEVLIRLGCFSLNDLNIKLKNDKKILDDIEHELRFLKLLE